MAELAKRIPIRHFIDHGPNVQPSPEVDAFLAKVYPQLYASAKHTVLKTGDNIPLAGATVKVSAENTIVASFDCPDTNRWWPQTRNDSSASEIDEYAMKR